MSVSVSCGAVRQPLMIACGTVLMFSRGGQVPFSLVLHRSSSIGSNSFCFVRRFNGLGRRSFFCSLPDRRPTRSPGADQVPQRPQLLQLGRPLPQVRLDLLGDARSGIGRLAGWCSVLGRCRRTGGRPGCTSRQFAARGRRRAACRAAARSVLLMLMRGWPVRVDVDLAAVDGQVGRPAAVVSPPPPSSASRTPLRFLSPPNSSSGRHARDQQQLLQAVERAVLAAVGRVHARSTCRSPPRPCAASSSGVDPVEDGVGDVLGHVRQEHQASSCRPRRALVQVEQPVEVDLAALVGHAEAVAAARRRSRR